MRRLVLGVVIALAACGGSGGGSMPIAGPSGNPSDVPSSSPAPGLATTQFTLVVSSGTNTRQRSYVSLGTQSVTITLNSVNGGAPPAGLTTSVTSNITASSCTSGCTVSGPFVPPGSDAFTIATFSGANGGGSALSEATTTFSVSASAANSIPATLLGIPATFSLSGVPSGSAGTAIASTPLTLTAKDASGNAITGGYFNIVTIADSDTSSLTLGSSLTLNGGSAATSVASTASTDTIAFAYGGLAIVPATISASATAATTHNVAFAPVLHPIVPSTSEVDLYATSGTGSSGSFTAAETGWTNPPYSQNIAVTVPGGCSAIATVSPGSGTSFTATVAASPSSGTCTPTLSDGASQTANVTLTYTTSAFSVNTRPHKP